MKAKGQYSRRIMLGRCNYNIIVSVAIYRHQTIPVTVQDQATVADISYFYYYSVIVYTRRLLQHLTQMQRNTKFFQWTCSKRKDTMIRHWKTRGHQTKIKNTILAA